MFLIDFFVQVDDGVVTVLFDDDWIKFRVLDSIRPHARQNDKSGAILENPSRETGALRRRPSVGRPTQRIGIWAGGWRLDGVEEDGFSGLDPRAKGDRSQAACLRRPVPHGVRTTAAWSSPCPGACVDS